MSTLDTIPGVIQVGSSEIAIYNFDTTAILGTGESLQVNPAPSAQVLTQANYNVVPGALVAQPGVSGNLLQVNVSGLALTLKQAYYLIVTYYTTPTKRLQFRCEIDVVL